MMKSNMYLEINNGNSGLLISDENKKWYYFDSSEISCKIDPNEIGTTIDTIRKAIENGDLYSADDFIYEYENDDLHTIKEFDGLSIDDIDNIENYEITDCGDIVPRNHDITVWYKI